MSSLRVLVIGGSRFVGRQLAHQLVARGDRVTLLNRGSLDDGLGARVERLLVDRRTAALDAALAGRRFDVVIDFAAFTGDEVERLQRVLGASIGRYVLVSSGQVMLVREGCRTPAREEDYDGPLMPAPDDARDRAEWEYGMGKRSCEDAITSGPLADRAVRLRVPVLHGPGDPQRRLERLIARMLDGGPILVPRADAIVRHVYGPWLARFLVDRLDHPRFLGAIHVAPEETTTVREVIERVAALVGASAPRVPVEAGALASHGLRAEDVGPFGGRWASVLDPSRAVRELALAHPSLDAWLPGAVHAVLAHHAADPPPDLAHRPRELALAHELLGGP